MLTSKPDKLLESLLISSRLGLHDAFKKNSYSVRPKLCKQQKKIKDFLQMGYFFQYCCGSVQSSGGQKLPACKHFFSQKGYWLRLIQFSSDGKHR